MTPILFLKAQRPGSGGTGDLFGGSSAGTHSETRTRKDGVTQAYHVGEAKKHVARAGEHSYMMGSPAHSHARDAHEAALDLHDSAALAHKVAGGKVGTAEYAAANTEAETATGHANKASAHAFGILPSKKPKNPDHGAMTMKLAEEMGRAGHRKLLPEDPTKNAEYMGLTGKATADRPRAATHFHDAYRRGHRKQGEDVMSGKYAEDADHAAMATQHAGARGTPEYEETARTAKRASATAKEATARVDAVPPDASKVMRNPPGTPPAANLEALDPKRRKIRRGDRVHIRPEWQDEGDDQHHFVAMDDENDRPAGTPDNIRITTVGSRGATGDRGHSQIDTRMIDHAKSHTDHGFMEDTHRQQAREHGQAANNLAGKAKEAHLEASRAHQDASIAHVKATGTSAGRTITSRGDETDDEMRTRQARHPEAYEAAHAASKKAYEATERAKEATYKTRSGSVTKSPERG